MTNHADTNSEEYNGWSNRETWAASLHLSNDYGIYGMVNGWAQDANAEAIRDALADDHGFYLREIFTVEATTVRNLADKLRGYIDTLRADMSDGNDVSETERMMVLEIGSEWRVDWFEVARNWLDGFEFEDEGS